MGKFGQYTVGAEAHTDTEVNRSNDDVCANIRKETSVQSEGSLEGCFFEESKAPVQTERSRKRSCGSDGAESPDTEDILSQICSRMTSLSTKDPLTNRDDMIVAFVSVLRCTSDEATFFLESSVWNIEAAVHLWLDTQKSDPMWSWSGLRWGGKNDSSDGFSGAKRLRQSGAKSPFTERSVAIEGLPEGWTAWVDRSHGGIYFENQYSGHIQTAVPPGFADSTWAQTMEGASHCSQHSQHHAQDPPQSCVPNEEDVHTADDDS